MSQNLHGKVTDKMVKRASREFATCERLTGKSLSKENFQFSVVDRVPSGQWKQIARGHKVGEIVKGFLTQESCARILQNFVNSPALRQRQDGVPGETLGVDLYMSSPKEYLTKTLAQKADVSRLFQGTVNVPQYLRETLQRTMPRGGVVRPAIFDGIEYNSVRGIRWTDNGKYSLKFHDDQAQLRAPGQMDMETSRIEYPVAFDVYPSVSDSGGALVVYNIAPDDKSRTHLGLHTTGYPYPDELLEDFDRLTVVPEVGDLVILSGRFVHGVTGIVGQTPRILLNHFGGFIDRQTFVTWS